MKQYKYILEYNGETYELENNPAGWNDIGLQLERHEVYHSLLGSVTLSLRFPRNKNAGYEFIKSAYEDKGIYATINISIYERNPSTNGYDLFYSGVLDLTPKQLIVSRNYIQANIVASDKLHKLLSRDELNVNMFSDKTVDETEVSSINLKQITLTPVDIILESLLTCDCDESQTWSDFALTKYLFQNPNYEIQNISSVNFDGAQTVYTNTNDYSVKVSFSYKSQLNITGLLTYTGSGTFHINCYLKRYTAAGALFSTQSVYSNDITLNSGASPYSLNISDSVDFYYKTSIPIGSGGYVKMYYQMDFTGSLVNPGPDATGIRKVETPTINIREYNDGYPETTCDTFLAHEVFSRAIQLITGESDTSKLLYSTILGRTDSQYIVYSETGEAGLDAIFNGFMCRNYPNPQLNIKFNELFKLFDAIYSVGLGYDKANDRFYIEKMQEFFNPNYQMFDLGEVSNLEITPLDKGYFNKITAGYDNDGDYEELQGAYEFNVKREYSTAAPVDNELDIQTKYRADSVGIETTRRYQYKQDSSKDAKDDSTVFLVRTDGNKPVLDETVTGFAGIENYYNTMISPRQNAIRNGSILATTLFRDERGLTAQATDKLFSMSVNGIDENSDIDKSELGDSLFLPEMYTFDSYITQNIVEILMQNPHGSVKFTNFGVAYEGYIMKLETGEYNKKAKYTLIAKTPVFNDSYIYEDGENFIFEDGENFIFE